MKNYSLSNAEVIQLDEELNGKINPQTGEKIASGLLSESLPIRTRYWLDRVKNQLEARKTSIEKLKTELIKKLGEEKDGNFSIQQTTEEGKGEKKKTIINPNFVEFITEYSKVLEEKEDIACPELTIEDLGDLKTELNLTVFFKLIQEPTSEDK